MEFLDTSSILNKAYFTVKQLKDGLFLVCFHNCHERLRMNISTFSINSKFYAVTMFRCCHDFSLPEKNFGWWFQVAKSAQKDGSIDITNITKVSCTDWYLIYVRILKCHGCWAATCSRYYSWRLWTDASDVSCILTWNLT